MFFFQAGDGIRDLYVTGVQTCALPISGGTHGDALTPAKGVRAMATDNENATRDVRDNVERSEERRVGKECRSRGWRDRPKQKSAAASTEFNTVSCTH